MNPAGRCNGGWIVFLQRQGDKKFARVPPRLINRAVSA
jgi:hypothetical protein